MTTSDHLLFFANRLFLRHILDRGGLGSESKFVQGQGLRNCIASPEVIACREGIRRVVAWFIRPVLEGDTDSTPAEFIRQILAEFEAAGRVTETFREHCRQAAAHEYGAKPFAREMARPIEEWTEGEMRLEREKLKTEQRFEASPA